jgi:cystine transport system substrate-binding protein
MRLVAAVAILGTAALAALTARAAGEPDVLARAKASGTLRVATTLASPPWSLVDEQNRPAGYDVDVANELAKRLGVPKVEFVGSTFQNFIPGVQSDRFDLVIAGQTITEERKQQVDFSIPYEVNGVAIFVNASTTNLKTVADLAGKRIGVTAGGTQETYARRNIPNADVRTYDNAILALTDLHIGRIDAALYSRFTGAYLAQKHGLKVKPLAQLLNMEINAISFKKGQPALKADIDRILTAMIADGTLARISKQWLGGLDMTEELKNLPK